MNLWGCACEDLLTRQDSEGRNIVDDYLTRRYAYILVGDDILIVDPRTLRIVAVIPA